MLVKDKRVRAIFLAFLVICTHNSFPFSWEVIGKKRSHFVKIFQHTKKNLSMKSGASIGRIAVGIIGGTIFIGAIFYFTGLYMLGKWVNVLEKIVFDNLVYKRSEKRLTLKNDFAGNISPKIENLIEVIKNEDIYKAFKVKTKKDKLICGKKGTSKKWLIKVLKGEIDANLYSITGSSRKDNPHMRSHIKEVFDLAKEEAKESGKYSIIRVDNFDKIEKRHGYLFPQMKMKKKDDAQVIVFGLVDGFYEVNDKEELRWFEKIEVGRPDIEEIKKSLHFYINKYMKSKEAQEIYKVDVDFSALADKTRNFSQGMLASVVNDVFGVLVEEHIKRGRDRNNIEKFINYIGSFVPFRKKILIQNEKFEEKVEELRKLCSDIVADYE